MQQAHAYTTNREKPKLALTSRIIAPYWEQNVLTQLNQVFLTAEEEKLCELATD